MSANPNNLVPNNPNFIFDDTIRIARIMQLVGTGLKNQRAHVPLSTKDKTLGDRNKYIGASSATGCLLKSYLDVKEPTETSLLQMFVFERGHQLEEMVRKGLNGIGYKEIDYVSQYTNNGKYVIHQEEAVGPKGWEFLKAHLDFVFVGKNELVIKEMKSSSTIPDQPYESHVFQTLLQMWLLKNKYPKYKIRGSVVYYNWDSGESEEYEIEYAKPLLLLILKKVKTLWYTYQNNVAPEASAQLYCGKCERKATCPLIQDGALTTLPNDLVPMAKRLVELKKVDKELKKLKDNFKSLLTSAGIKKATLGDITISVVKVKGKKVVSMNKLRNEHLDVYNELSEEVGGYEWLKVV